MKNLRGSVLTLLAAIIVASVAGWAIAQGPPPELAGSMPLPSPAVVPVFANPPTGSGDPQGVIMPPPPAMAQFQNAAIASQTPLAVAQIPSPQAMYHMPIAAGYGAPAFGPAAYGAYGQPGYAPGFAPQPNWGVQPASYATPQPFPGMSAATVPAGFEMGAGYGNGGYAGGGYAGGGYAGGGGCASCGGHGCAACAGYHAGFFDRLLSRLLPYGEGGQCAPRWYDVTLDAMYLSRDNAGRNTDFASDGIGGDIVLSTDDLNFKEELGFRFTGAHQIFAGATAEFTYFGLFNWTAAAEVTRDPADFPPIPPPPAQPPFADDLYSVLSEFGTNPFGGFDETDRSRRQSLRYSSTIDNFELNFRKRFTAPNCRVQYSWLAGVRYLYLLEDFEYFTLGGGGDAMAMPPVPPRGFMDYDVRTRNSLTGFQVGGDGWLNVVPGVNVGADIKAGVYGNYADQTTNILATTTTPDAGTTFNNSVHGNDIALIADANIYFMWRLGPHWTVRAGYNFLYLDGVALGSENFNTAPPNILTGGMSTQTRVPTINDNGNLFYHGGFGGVEWQW